MKKVTKIWKTKDGREIRICDMTDQHLKNTIKMLEKTAETTTQKRLHSLYRTSLIILGGHASINIDKDIASLTEKGISPEEISPLYSDLLTEAARRKIK